MAVHCKLYWIERIRSWFLATAILFLVVTGLAKVVSAFHGGELNSMLSIRDPLLGIQFRRLLLIVGVLELLVAVLCAFWKDRIVGIASVAILATNILIYRVGLLMIDYHRPCGCLGGLTEALGISSELADTFMKIVLGYLVVGSYIFLLVSRPLRGTADEPIQT